MEKVTVVGSWELGYNAPITEAPLWSFVLREFNVVDWWMWPISGVRNQEASNLTLHERADLDEILSEIGTGTKVFLEGRSEAHPATLDSTWLHEFDHPTDPVYIFGSAYHNTVVSHWTKDDAKVSIKTERDNGVLWPHQCLLVVLHDRMVKSWQ